MCGIFGAVTPGMDAAAMAALGVFSLQHRGQESAGIAVSDGEQLMLYKDLGLIAQVLDERRLPSLRGSLAISHCRYSTTGSTIWENAQPTFRMGRGGSIAIGHNGNLVNTRELLARLEGGKSRLPATTDTELLTALLADDPSGDTVEALKRVLPTVQGAYSLAILDEKRVIGVRDPHGFRPLVLGRIEPAAGDPEGRHSGGWLISSESAAIEVAGGSVVRDVEPGEIVILEVGAEPEVPGDRPAGQPQQGLHLGLGEAGEVGAISLHEGGAAPSAPLDDDRHPGRAQRLEVSVDGPA